VLYVCEYGSELKASALTSSQDGPVMGKPTEAEKDLLDGSLGGKHDPFQLAKVVCLPSLSDCFCAYTCSVMPSLWLGNLPGR